MRRICNPHWYEINELEDEARQEIANATDVTPGLAEAIQGKTWKEIFKMCMDQD